MINRVGAETIDLYRRAVRRFCDAPPDDRFLQSPGSICSVATDHDVIAGWCWGYALARPDGKSMLYLHELEVDPRYRRRGFGRDLLGEFMRLGRADERIEKLFLLTEQSNHPARSLYASCGGQPAATGPTVTYWFDLRGASEPPTPVTGS